MEKQNSHSEPNAIGTRLWWWWSSATNIDNFWRILYPWWPNHGDHQITGPTDSNNAIWLYPSVSSLFIWDCWLCVLYRTKLTQVGTCPSRNQPFNLDHCFVSWWWATPVQTLTLMVTTTIKFRMFHIWPMIISDGKQSNHKFDRSRPTLLDETCPFGGIYTVWFIIFFWFHNRKP